MGEDQAEKLARQEEGKVQAEGTEFQKQKVELTYKCDCCGIKFLSHRARQGEKLCQNCVELRRALKGFLKRGLSEAEVLKRAKKMLVPGKQE